MIENPAERKIAVARWAKREVDLLSSVTARALPRGGESGVIADAVAGMARRQANAERIAEIEQVVDYLETVIESDTYDAPRPAPPSAQCAAELERWDREWKSM